MPDLALAGLSALDAPSGLTKPARKGRPRRGRQAGPQLRKFRAHAALVVGSAAFTALMIGIVLNATVMQKEHHPAPLFGSAPVPARTPVAPPPQPAPVVTAPAVPAAPAVESVPAAAPAKLRPASSAAPAAPPKAGVAAAPHRPARKADGIAHLLGAPAPASAGAKSKPAPSHTGTLPAPVQPVHSRPLPPAR